MAITTWEDTMSFIPERKEDGSWAEPVNIGYPINTTDDDLFFQPMNNGMAAYYSVYSPRGIGLPRYLLHEYLFGE